MIEAFAISNTVELQPRWSPRETCLLDRDYSIIIIIIIVTGHFLNCLILTFKLTS